MIRLNDVPSQIHAIKPFVLPEIENVLDSGQYILGPRVKQLEQQLTCLLGVSDVVSVANGTDALVLSLDALGIGRGDEVITTPFTFYATAEAISRVGATPVFADIDRNTYTIHPASVEAAITNRTKAIIPVHLFGQAANMDPLMHIARTHRLYVIEDACQAFGATYKRQPVGSLADAACFSFFPTKNLGTVGDGGCITFGDAERAERVRQLRHHGSVRKYYHRSVGYNSRLDEIHAAILLVALDMIKEWNERRRHLALRYRDALQGVRGLTIRPEATYGKHVYHQFCVEVDDRSSLIEVLQENKIGHGIYYPLPLHLQEVYADLGYQKGDFPVSEYVSERLIALPIGPFLTEKQQDYVMEVIGNGQWEG